MRFPAVLLASICLFGILAGVAATPAAIEKRIQEMKAVALARGDRDYFTEVDGKAAGRIRAFKGKAIPYLLPMLRDSNEQIRKLTAFTLGDIEGLGEEHLDALLEAHRGGNEEIAEAIARTGTPRAVTYLMEALVRERRSGSSLTFAVGRHLAAPAMPELVAIFEREEGWDEALAETVECVLHYGASKAADAVEPLMKIAADPSRPASRRAWAIKAVGEIGPPAEAATDRLQALRKDADPAIQEAAAKAIVGLRGEAAARLLVEWFEGADGHGRTLLLRDIAALGTTGRVVGPAVLKLLKSEDWQVRELAARALGFIEYSEAEGDLLEQLSSVEDWKLVYCAAEALARLKERSALPTLDHLAKSHWFPSVREVAHSAAASIRGGRPYASPREISSSPGAFFQFPSRMPQKMSDDDPRLVKVPVLPSKMEKLPPLIEAEITSRHPQQGNLTSLKVADGYLIGTDRGEWGGEILFVDEQGDVHVVQDENTQDLYPIPGGALAIGGVGHGFNRGTAYRINRDAAGKWKAAPWRTLPGEPIFSCELRRGGWLVECIGGIVTISPTGEMKHLNWSEAFHSHTSAEGRKRLQRKGRPGGAN